MEKDVWNPPQYEKFKNERSQPFIDLLSLIQPLKFKDAIDLGCGTGELTRLMHDRFHPASTLGMDSSEAMLTKSKSYETPTLHFAQGDIAIWEKLEGYDLILSNAALQWIPNHQELFERLFRSLRSGGQLAVQMPMNHDYPTHTLAASLSREGPWKSLLHGHVYDKANTLLSVQDYASLLFKLGFREQNVSLKVYGHKLKSREEVIEWVRGSTLTHFESRLSAEDFQKFLSIYRERLFKVLPDEQPFFYPFKRIFLWARK